MFRSRLSWLWLFSVGCADLVVQFDNFPDSGSTTTTDTDTGEGGDSHVTAECEASFDGTGGTLDCGEASLVIAAGAVTKTTTFWLTKEAAPTTYDARTALWKWGADGTTSSDPTLVLHPDKADDAWLYLSVANGFSSVRGQSGPTRSAALNSRTSAFVATKNGPETAILQSGDVVNGVDIIWVLDASASAAVALPAISQAAEGFFEALGDDTNYRIAATYAQAGYSTVPWGTYVPITTENSTTVRYLDPDTPDIETEFKKLFTTPGDAANGHWAAAAAYAVNVRNTPSVIRPTASLHFVLVAAGNDKTFSDPPNGVIPYPATNPSSYVSALNTVKNTRARVALSTITTDDSNLDLCATMLITDSNVVDLNLSDSINKDANGDSPGATLSLCDVDPSANLATIGEISARLACTPLPTAATADKIAADSVSVNKLDGTPITEGWSFLDSGDCVVVTGEIAKTTTAVVVHWTPAE